MRRIASRIAGYSGAQLLIQLLNVLTGFLLVRSLDKPGYAWITIANGAMSTVSILADSGLGSAFTSLGGKHFQDPFVFAAIAKLIRQKRRSFMFVAAAVTLPFTGWALGQNEAPTPEIIVLLLLTAAAAFPSTDAVVLTTTNKLHRRVRNIVLSELTFSLSKFVMTGAACLAGISAITASACVLMSLWIQSMVLRRQTADLLFDTDVNTENFLPVIHRTVSHVLPTCIYSCFQSQISTGLLSYFASTNHVADLGALMRFSVIFTFLSLPIQQIFIPVIARCQERLKLRNRLYLLTSGVSAASILVVLLGHLTAPLLLMLIGPRYTHLQNELTFYLASSSLAFAANILWATAYSRAWVEYGWINIPVSLLLQLICAPMIDFSEVYGVLQLAIVSQFVSLLVVGILISRGFRRDFQVAISTSSSH